LKERNCLENLLVYWRIILKWMIHLYGERVWNAVKEIKYTGVVMDSRGTWDKERKQVAIRGKSAFHIINISMARAPNMEVKVLEQVYNALVESRMMTGVEIWGFGRRVEGD
jgi:hypothetical protein